MRQENFPLKQRGNIYFANSGPIETEILWGNTTLCANSFREPMTIRALRARGGSVPNRTIRFRGDSLGRACWRALEPSPRRFPFFLIFRGGMQN